ncbi:MAG: hypothetical protein IPL58_11400 [Betaproteobacteria bacterium]|jgi:hypothetical protein|uniref:Uncharacterized protein n=1 Tax=Candidatus Proximibacter danicus TaxID=2954365 RepID=A0A9D7K4U7_9PROT|nr:hypothetical protein [Candidatus Proximibacter danicus]MBK9446980.1 hypothetical protein [Betaproteobacteria bacterium]
MSGFENYKQELAGIDHEILHYASLCGVDIADHEAINACIHQPHEAWVNDKARETLHGLLILRVKVEEEMLTLGQRPPALGDC